MLTSQLQTIGRTRPRESMVFNPAAVLQSNAEVLERQDKRAAACADFIPRIQRQDDDQRASIEEQDAPEHRIDGARQRPARVLRFTGSQPQHFDSEVRVHHHLQRHQHASQAMWHKTAVLPQIGEAQRDTMIADAEKVAVAVALVAAALFAEKFAAT